MTSPTNPRRARRADSARYDPYYKVQWYDARVCAWRDVQKQHPTAEAAAAAYLKGKQCRTMEISPKGRRPL
jgi:hypothetical protein